MAFGHPTQSTNKGLWIMGRWLWLLTNQLYRPTPKCITPALGFGFAVDGEFVRHDIKSVLADLRSITKDPDTHQAGAIPDYLILDSGNAFRNRNARQVVAFPEGLKPDAGNAFRDRDTRQVTTSYESFLRDAGNTVRNSDAC